MQVAFVCKINDGVLNIKNVMKKEYETWGLTVNIDKYKCLSVTKEDRSNARG